MNLIFGLLRKGKVVLSYGRGENLWEKKNQGKNVKKKSQTEHSIQIWNNNHSN